MGFWQWFRDSQRPRRSSSMTPRAQPRHTVRKSVSPGQPTEVPQVFRAVPADTVGTWDLETPSGAAFRIRAIYGDLVRLLGQPNGDVSDKVTAEWVLLHDDGVFTIYDYKATSEYDKDLPTLAEFRRQQYDWHVGVDPNQAAARGASLVKKAVGHYRQSETSRRYPLR
jgi:hypothetical protein